ncbi:MAG TPA: peptidoglycan DD-metalloendopeptidase family protein, partial [Acidimicrobiia bacterium]|nr:peptidoglycan DD-metalloendopeptidase family protein [Acidimicrobiia bacterium]
ERCECSVALWKLLAVEYGVSVTGFAVKLRLFAPWAVSLACLTAAVTPAMAREGVDPDAPGRKELQRDVKESTSRYRKAKAEVDKLAAEIRRIETRLQGVDAQQEALRAMATKGAVALYMHDNTLEWADGGFGDGGNELLEAARRARLVGGVNVLAGAAVRNLSDSTKQILEDRRRLKDKRQEQEVALRKLDGERQAAAGRFSAFVAEERAEERQRRATEAAQRKAEAAQRKADAAARRASQRTSRAQPAGRGAMPPLPLGFVCPLNGPFKWGDGWGAGRGHRGVDLLAPRGSENVAVVPGTFETRFWGGGGLTLFLRGDDGHTYVYMHLLRIVGDSNRHVEAGEVIGLTGASGNASAYHLHFEIHPDGGGPIDAFSTVVNHCPPMPRDH